MAIFLSPGVYLKETDLSQIVRAIGSSAAALVIRANKGPTMEPTLCTTDKQFLELFGDPNPNLGAGHYSALAYLKQGTALWVVRAPSTGQQFAGMYANLPTVGACWLTDADAMATPEPGNANALSTTFGPGCRRAYAATLAPEGTLDWTFDTSAGTLTVTIYQSDKTTVEVAAATITTASAHVVLSSVTGGTFYVVVKNNHTGNADVTTVLNP